MTIIEQIKAEIERRIKIQDDWAGRKVLPGRDLAFAVKEELKQLLFFLSTLEESERPEPYNPVYDEAYLNEKIKKATESWKGVDVDAMLAECRGYNEEESEKPVPADLEEAAVDIADALLAKPKDYVLSAKADYLNGAQDGVIAGAKWLKEQMLKEAVEGKIEEVSFNNGELHNTIFFSFDEESLHVENRIWVPRCGKDGDKVRIIIVKED